MRNKTVADIFADFRSDGLARQHRYEAACDQNPDLRAVREQVREIALVKMQCALLGQSSTAYDQTLSALAEQEKELVEKMGKRRYLCDRCRDTGMAGGEYCNCLLRRIYREYYGAVDIKRAGICFERFSEDIFDDCHTLPCGKTQRELMKWNLGIARKYLEQFPETKRKNMLLTGKAGLGKSFLLYCMAKEAFEKELDVMLIRANQLFSVFFSQRMGEETELSFLHNVPLLMIDDIGTEPITQNVSVEYFYELIAKRLEAGRHTVFATNVDDLQNRYDDRIASRMESREDCIRLLFDGRDLRV